jgi:two-component system nitrate/nitrite response regulator NarL
MSGTPLVVTHPCALVRDVLRVVLANSRFRLLHTLPTLDGDTEGYLGSAGTCIWLLGVRKYAFDTNDLLRRVVAANPSVRTVILAASHTAMDVVLALSSGAYGFLGEDISSGQLIKSLEVIVFGQTVVHPVFRPTLDRLPANDDHKANGESYRLQLSDLRSSAKVLGQPAPAPGNDVVRLSRREVVILRTLTEGASNKIIASKLVITESTVKVHMKAILRKLRLQNRTQAAIWARTHLGELLESTAA